MGEIRYFCDGGCGGSVNEEEFEAGTTTCGAHSCPDYGKPFVKKEKCLTCEQWQGPGEHCACAAMKDTS